MRTFEFRSGKSAKFWSIDVIGKKVTTQWGKLGTTGQTKAASLASPAAANAAAEKQIAEKLRKGYVEAAKAVSQIKPVVSQASNDDLFARGYPHLRRLGPALGKGVPVTVKKTLAAGDPELGVDVPEDVARAFLSAITFGRNQVAEREAALKKPAEIDRALFNAFLDRVSTNIAETYSFRILDAIWLFEAFLGTEQVADMLVTHFVKIVSPTKWDQLDNANYHAFDLADALGYMRLRVPSVTWTSIIKPLLAVKKSKLLFSERILLLLDPGRPVRGENMSGKATEIALQRGDAMTLRKLYKNDAYWYSARFAYLVGDEHFETIEYAKLLRLPTWLQRQIVAQYGMLHGPHIANIMQTLVTGRSAAKEAKAWLDAHGAPAPAAKSKTTKLTIAQANKQIDRAMARLEKRLLAADKRDQKKILKGVFQTYCEARAAAGESMPDVHFTHRFGEIPWTVPNATWNAWLDLALDL